MDVLDRLVELAQLSGAVDTRCVFQGDWKIKDVDQQQGHAQLHIVVKGQAYLQLDQTAPKLLHEGDLFFLPRARAHQLCSSPTFVVDELSAPEETSFGSFTVKKMGTEGARTELFCGHFSYSETSDLMKALPEYVFLNFDHPSLGGLIELLQYEAQAQERGANSIINSLSIALLTLIIRRHMVLAEHEVLSRGVLLASRDRRLYPLIHAVLDLPQENWTVENLAELACVSRAQLMRLFKQHVGMSPHHFVQHVRLQRAAQMLRQSSYSILHIALAVGFQSETHFGKAFKQKYGVTPGQYRR